METDSLQVVAIIFPGFELLDLFGPLELFGMLGDRVSLLVAAQVGGAVPSAQGPFGYADKEFSNVKSTDIILVPGGIGTRKEVENKLLLGFLHELSGSAKYVTSVCTGSALLAKSGVLDGRKATSNKRAFEWVVTQGPNVQWVRKARWVEDGRFFTSSGVSAGMDMTLGLIARIFGQETSLQVASRAEYLWQEDSSVDPFATVDSKNG